MINQEIIKAKLNAMCENLVKLKAELETTDEALKKDDRAKSALGNGKWGQPPLFTKVY